MDKTIKIQGETLYPVCSFLKNQHKIENAYNKAYCDYIDSQTDYTYDRWQEISDIYEYFNSHVYHGVVYAGHDMSNAIKEIISGYDLHTDEMIAKVSDPERKYLMSVNA